MSSRRLVPKVSNDVSLTHFLIWDRRSAVLPPPPPTSPIPKKNAWLTDVDVDPGEYEIIDGRLHDLYDAGCVKAIFSQLRKQETSTLLETGVYNALIEMHFGMATQKELENQDSWLGEVFDLYKILDSGAEHVAPHSITYRLCSCSVPGYSKRLPSNISSYSNICPKKHLSLEIFDWLIARMHQCQISPSLVIAETVFDMHETAIETIQTLSQVAIYLNILEAVTQLGRAEAVASPEDGLQDVPEAIPVMSEPTKMVTLLWTRQFLLTLPNTITTQLMLATPPAHAQKTRCHAKPQPWTSCNTGGYIYCKTPVMRYKDFNKHIAIKMADMMFSLNVLHRSRRPGFYTMEDLPHNL
ncbi:hypothetical protein D9756_008141 [Leucocoprinus leucothites]|uniref:DNA-directed RNA polymerase N-terminal domain-containing protein n=1 Tax=Leucocoprinus leucothites TaxID=201217 RepID=A0A8H5D4H4_9AGAR|nr:hypothetical protein D9756_008141 [Leucoagaricus leucothites]